MLSSTATPELEPSPERSRNSNSRDGKSTSATDKKESMHRQSRSQLGKVFVKD